MTASAFFFLSLNLKREKAGKRELAKLSSKINWLRANGSERNVSPEPVNKQAQIFCMVNLTETADT